MAYICLQPLRQNLISVTEHERVADAALSPQRCSRTLNKRSRAASNGPLSNLEERIPMKPIHVFGGTLLALAGAVSLAQEVPQAQGPVVLGAGAVNLYAGPARSFPLVRSVAPGVFFNVHGCVVDYSWCDVSAGVQLRGWAYAGDLVFNYGGTTLPVLNNGQLLGVGVVPFNLANYWDSYYTRSPWYVQRPAWVNRFPQPWQPGTQGANPGYGPGGWPPGAHPGGSRSAPYGGDYR